MSIVSFQTAKEEIRVTLKKKKPIQEKQNKTKKSQDSFPFFETIRKEKQRLGKMAYNSTITDSNMVP